MLVVRLVKLELQIEQENCQIGQNIYTHRIAMDRIALEIENC